MKIRWNEFVELLKNPGDAFSSKAEVEIDRDKLLALIERRNEKDKWPKEGDMYWCIYGNGDVVSSPWFDGCTIDTYRKRIGNIYRTKAEAEYERDRRALIKELCDYRDELGCTMPENGDIYCTISYTHDGWFTERRSWPYFSVEYDLGLSGYNNKAQAQQALSKFKDRLSLLLPYKASE